MSTRAGSTRAATAELLTPAGEFPVLPDPEEPDPSPEEPDPSPEEPEPNGSDPKPDPEPSLDDPEDGAEPSALEPPPVPLTERSTNAPAEPETATTAAAPAATKAKRRVLRGRPWADRDSVST
jgi:hypothetical protein